MRTSIILPILLFCIQASNANAEKVNDVYLGISHYDPSLPVAELEFSYPISKISLSAGFCTNIIILCIKQKSTYHFGSNLQYGIYVSPGVYGAPLIGGRNIDVFVVDVGAKIKLSQTINPIYRAKLSHIEIGAEYIADSCCTNIYPKLKLIWAI